jgi:hypothetical protein
MLKMLLTLASIVNCAGGLVLIATWGGMWERVPIIVLYIGAALLIQGAFTILYLRSDLDGWGQHSSTALFAGQGVSAFVGATMLIMGILHNMQHDDLEMAPVLAGLLMFAQALLALLYLFAARGAEASL